MNTVKDKAQESWGNIILCYDNMCHLDGLKAAKEPLSLPPPYNQMWIDIKKIIDSLHIRNHVGTRGVKKDMHQKQLKKTTQRLIPWQ